MAELEIVFHALGRVLEVGLTGAVAVLCLCAAWWKDKAAQKAEADKLALAMRLLEDNRASEAKLYERFLAASAESNKRYAALADELNRTIDLLGERETREIAATYSTPPPGPALLGPGRDVDG